MARAKTLQQLQNEIDDLKAENEELQDQLDSIPDILAPAEGDDDEEEEEEVGDEGDYDDNGRARESAHSATPGAASR